MLFCPLLHFHRHFASCRVQFIEEFRNDQTKVNILLEEAEQLREDRRVLSKIFPSGKGRSPMPVNIDRLIVNAQKTFTITVHSKSDLHPLEVCRTWFLLLSFGRAFLFLLPLIATVDCFCCVAEVCGEIGRA